MTTAGVNFNDVYSANLVGLWDFISGNATADTGLDDGQAQDGVFLDGANPESDQLVTNHACDERFEVRGNDTPFDLANGTIIVRFAQDVHNGASPDSLVTRGEYTDLDTEGFLDIRVTKDGAVEVYHNDGSTDITVSTQSGFFDSGDDVEVFYAWSETGGALKVVNHTSGAEQTIDIAAALTLEIGDDDDASFVFGARTVTDGQFDKEFDGSIDYVAVYDGNVVTGPMLDGIVEGTTEDDQIDLAYTGDPESDMIDNGDAILPGAGADDDIVDAGAGDDTISSEDGDDVVYAGTGSDTVSGGEGDDTIYGDQSLASESETVREALQWAAVADPDDGSQIDDGDDLSAGFTQNTGNVDVSFSVLNATSDVSNTFDKTLQFVGGIDAGEAQIDADSAFRSHVLYAGQSADYALDFSTEVDNVAFRVNDIDGDGIVRIQAYDADGNALEVTLTAGANLAVSDTDAVTGADTARQATDTDNYADPDAPENSLLVEIAGPVARIEIAHDQFSTSGSAIGITDVYFDVAVDDPAGDVLFGDAGDDSIYGEDGADIVVGGEGSDFLSGGADADLFGTGAGDTIVGGETGDDNDTILASSLATVTWDNNDSGSESGTVTYYDENLNVIGTADFSEVENVVALNIQTGNTSLNLGTSLNGLVEGTNQNDVIDLAYDQDPQGDKIDNMDALPPLRPNQDIALGFAGDDEIYGEDDTDFLFGGIGNDTIFGQEGNDGLSGDFGNDFLSGGEGSDIVTGGSGDDTISGDNTIASDGADLLYGNFGDDTFIDIGEGDFIDGGEDIGGNDIDVLDLTGAGETVNPGGGYATVTYDPNDAEAGTVNFFQADGTQTGSSDFINIERVIGAQICFTPGTVIATPQGERLVQDLKVGDRVITRDNGIQQIRWVGKKTLSGGDLQQAPHLRPVMIKAGSLGDGLPERDMMLSPNHRVLVVNDMTSVYFEDSEVLVASKHLTGLSGINVVDVPQTTYIHLLFDNHEVILSDGAWTESFQPGDYSMAGLGNVQRNEIYELFPELENEKGLMGYTAARRALKRYEAKVLFS